MAEAQDVGFRSAVDAVQRLDRDADNRRDVDDRPFTTRHERRRDSIGKARQCGDVQVDHCLHLVDVGLQDRRDGADASIIDQHGDARIVAKHSLDLGEAALCIQIRRQHRDLTAGFAAKPISDNVQPLLVSRDQDQVATAFGEAIGVNGTDAGRRPGYEGGALGGETAHGCFLSVAALSSADRRYG
jgi:hypothetical protein